MKSSNKSIFKDKLMKIINWTKRYNLKIKVNEIKERMSQMKQQTSFHIFTFEDWYESE
jgi:hypothetical protein